MRTTLTIDNDISVVLTKMQRELHLPFKKLVNDTLREGLVHMMNPNRARPKKKFVTNTVSVGEVFVPNLDNVSEILAA